MAVAKEELDALFDNRSSDITSDLNKDDKKELVKQGKEKIKKECQFFMKNYSIRKILFVLAVSASALYLGATHGESTLKWIFGKPIQNYSKEKTDRTLLIVSDDESRDLERVRKYCFGWSWEKDAVTCKVWLHHYRHLPKYTESELFAEDRKEEASKYFDALQIPYSLDKSGNMGGNVQSSAG